MTNPPKIAPELKDLPHILITDVEPLQGDLKELTTREYNKLKKSLLERGFIFPLFIWKEQNKILDGHQRQRVYIKEGWLVKLPYVPVSAETEQEAKEKLLLASAQYGHITQEGFDAFTFDLDPDWIQETVHFDALPFVFNDFETITKHDSLEDTPDELPGAAALKPYMNFSSDLPWDIPPLIPDMLIPIPQPIDTWAGPDVCTDDGEMNWVYNWGSDSVIDLPMDRTLLAFYLDDAKFENFWFQPDKYVAKMINRGIGMSIAPNYSLWSDAARATHLYNVYRSRWVARYFQEAGIYVVPDINWADERSFEFCLLGIPENLPAVSVQLQTVKTDNEIQRAASGLQYALDVLKPRQVLIYGFTAAQEVIEQVNAGCEVIYIENRSAKRRIRHSQRDKEVLR